MVFLEAPFLSPALPSLKIGTEAISVRSRVCRCAQEMVTLDLDQEQERYKRERERGPGGGGAVQWEVSTTKQQEEIQVCRKARHLLVICQISGDTRTQSCVGICLRPLLESGPNGALQRSGEGTQGGGWASL